MFGSVKCFSHERLINIVVCEIAPNAAALAAFATAIAPLAANAEELDTSAVAGFGVGLVACVVFFAVGFSVGYGTLVKP